MKDKSVDNGNSPVIMTGKGVAVDFGGKSVRLKWHKLRRRMDDPLFSAANLVEGLRLGASMEVDLRATRDGHLAVLHGETVDEETTGTGRVLEHTAADIRTFWYRDKGGECQRHVMTDDDLAIHLDGADPEALLQLDMKDDLATVGAAGVDRLSALFAAAQPNLVVSGDCTNLTLSLAERLPDMQRGLEPSFRLLDLYRTGGKKAVASRLMEELRGPIRPCIVYLAWKLILAARRDGTDLVRICHDTGAEVDAWTFTPASPSDGFADQEWRNLLELLETGIDQISTDDPLGIENGFRKRMASD